VADPSFNVEFGKLTPATRALVGLDAAGKYYVYFYRGNTVLAKGSYRLSG
jgi:hypothetical protein